MFARCRDTAIRFQSNDQGAVAMLFGLISVILVFFGGLAVDYGRIVDLRGRLADAVDAASLAAGRAMLDGQLSDGEIVTMAKTFINENARNNNRLGTISEPLVTLNRDTGSVDISVMAQLEMTLARIAGFKRVDIPVRSEAVFQQRDIEVGMALDVTGSMGGFVGGQRKIDALKDAFETFADRLIPDQQSSAQRVRIGLAPYAAAINVGSYAGTASNGASTDGCVVERHGGQNSDAVATYNVADGSSNNVDSAGARRPYACPSAELTPLSDDKSALIRKVRNYSPRGSTGGHFGAQWAWNLVSEDWGRVFGGDSAADSYERVTDKKLIKAVVLMTDGEFNTAYTGGRSSEQALRLCSAMKAKDVIVFSVGFGLGGNQTALDTLRGCASQGDGYFADASSPEELEAAFSAFAAKLTALRLSN